MSINLRKRSGKILVRSILYSRKIFQFYPKSNFSWHKLVSPEKKNFEQITEKEWISKFTVGIFEIRKNTVTMTF